MERTGATGSVSASALGAVWQSEKVRQVSKGTGNARNMKAVFPLLILTCRDIESGEGPLVASTQVSIAGRSSISAILPSVATCLAVDDELLELDGVSGRKFTVD